jgi:hypothetical protein
MLGLRRKKTEPVVEPPVEVEHIPCLYEVTFQRGDGTRRIAEVVATSAKGARAEVAERFPYPIEIVRTFREGFIE